MTAINFILVSILYFWCSSTSLSLGIGYYTLYRPIVSGMLTGLILGDFSLGMLAGAVINIIYIDFVSTGGSFKGDQCLTAIIASAAAILYKLTPVEAAAIAYPFGYIGILLWKYRLNINTLFVNIYDNKYKIGLKPNISIYNGFLPQLLLFIMSSAVTALSIIILFLIKGLFIYIKDIRSILFIMGIFLINISIFNRLLKLEGYKNIIIFLAAVIITFVFNINYIIILFLLLIIIYVIIKDISLNKDKNLIINNDKKVLRKIDLLYSWFIWMNFSHSCYNYERLQGMAFAHSMKNVIKKLYRNDVEIFSGINRYTEFFNTEPNVGTPIHGYIIYLEEQKSLGSEIVNISYIKKGMMGIAAGMGDSFTQVVLTPLFILMSLIICFDKKIVFALIPITALGLLIIYISYSGWINGYIYGKDALIRRINLIKNNRIKKYYPIIYNGLFGCLVSRLIIYNFMTIKENMSATISATIISLIYMIAARIIGNIKIRGGGNNDK